MGSSASEALFLEKGVDVGCLTPIRVRFDVLLLDRGGLRQIDLANACSVDKAKICRVVNGKDKPSPELLAKICAFLKVDSAVLFGEEFFWDRYKQMVKSSSQLERGAKGS